MWLFGYRSWLAIALRKRPWRRSPPTAGTAPSAASASDDAGVAIANWPTWTTAEISGALQSVGVHQPTAELELVEAVQAAAPLEELVELVLGELRAPSARGGGGVVEYDDRIRGGCEIS